VSDQPQYVFDNATKKRWDLPERTILPMPENVARLFLQGDRAKYVQVYAPSPIPEIPGEATVWVANMTGNPFAPDKRSNRQGTQVDNPNKKPQDAVKKNSSRYEAINLQNDDTVEFYPELISFGQFTKDGKPVGDVKEEDDEDSKAGTSGKNPEDGAKNPDEDSDDDQKLD
jgi:hypothetical protein